MAKDLAIVLNSGSINSAVTTAIAAQKHRTVLLHAEVSASSAGSRARAAYDQQVAHFKPYREHTLAMSYLAGIAGAQPQPVATDPPPHGAISRQLPAALPLLPSAAPWQQLEPPAAASPPPAPVGHAWRRPPA